MRIKPSTELSSWGTRFAWLLLVLLAILPLRATIPFWPWIAWLGIGAHLIALTPLLVRRIPRAPVEGMVFAVDALLLLLFLNRATETTMIMLIMFTLPLTFWLIRTFDIRSGLAMFGLLALLDLAFNRVLAGNEAILQAGLWWLVASLLLSLLIGTSLAGSMGSKPHGSSHDIDKVGGKSVATLAEHIASLTGIGPILEATLQATVPILQNAYGEPVRAVGFTFNPQNVDELLVVATHKIEATWFGRRVRLTSLQEALNTGQLQCIQADMEVGREFPMFRRQWLLLVPLFMRLDIYGLLMFGLPKRPNLEQDAALVYVRTIAVMASQALHTQKVILELQRSREDVLADEEDWRHKMARDLHDGPVQRVAAIAMQADFIMALLRNQPDRVPEELKELRENALQTAQELRTLMFTLRPVVLETEGLIPALEQYVSRLKEQENLEIHLYADPLPKMDDTLEQTIFAIVQEAVGNAKKHAVGAPITVRVERVARGLLVQVEDEGPGFDVEAVLDQYGRRTSLGMVNMRERAAMIDGVLDIRSAPGEGTVVELFVPL